VQRGLGAGQQGFGLVLGQPGGPEQLRRPTQILIRLAEQPGGQQHPAPVGMAHGRRGG
jgi:hypothetical protein